MYHRISFERQALSQSALAFSEAGLASAARLDFQIDGKIDTETEIEILTALCRNPSAKEIVLTFCTAPDGLRGRSPSRSNRVTKVGCSLRTCLACRRRKQIARLIQKPRHCWRPWLDIASAPPLGDTASNAGSPCMRRDGPYIASKKRHCAKFMGKPYISALSPMP
jgi:hypothetical protein